MGVEVLATADGIGDFRKQTKRHERSEGSPSWMSPFFDCLTRMMA